MLAIVDNVSPKLKVAKSKQIVNRMNYFCCFRNPRLPCHSLPSIDLGAWRENADHGCQIGGRLVPVGDSALPTPCTSCICTSEGVSIK